MAKRARAVDPAADTDEMDAVPDVVLEETPPVEPAPEVTVEIVPEPSPAVVESTVEVAAAPQEPAGPLWAVTVDGLTDIVPAATSGEAWSTVCDRRRCWPSPKKGKVERVEPLPAVP